IWDVGAGSGSVSVECARVAWAGKVYAVEKKESALALTARNVEKFGLRNVEIVPGSAPEALSELPAPTHVFIGGSGGKLRPILDIILAKNPAARIVVNAVTLETVAELTELCPEFTVADVACVQVSKPRLAGRYHLMTAQNGVYIFTFQYRKETGAH
ncbi:MAG: precorrin-6Y C5,15-methyltransferase (decarboxylating) subunit CbiT, partial [Oscillospiraceae bacterium]|nr:precorrin-6Y C5,15-methyltransferase (decarboxylating) subunit CbiT [Oscillospiraceae bacterium]